MKGLPNTTLYPHKEASLIIHSHFKLEHLILAHHSAECSNCVYLDPRVAEKTTLSFKMISNFKFMNENFQLNENQPSNSEMPVGGRGVEV